MDSVSESAALPSSSSQNLNRHGTRLSTIDDLPVALSQEPKRLGLEARESVPLADVQAGDSDDGTAPPSRKRSQGVLRVRSGKPGEMKPDTTTGSRRSVKMSDVIEFVGSEPETNSPRAEPTPSRSDQSKKSHSESRKSSSRRSKSRVAPESESPTRFEDDQDASSRNIMIGSASNMRVDDSDAVSLNSATSGSLDHHPSPSQQRGRGRGGDARDGDQDSLVDSDSDKGGLAGKKKTSIASSSQSRSSAAVFHKAIEHDAKNTESSLVFLRRALYVVWLTVIAASVTILVVDSGIVAGATDDEQVVRSEGDRASLHTVSTRL